MQTPCSGCAESPNQIRGDDNYEVTGMPPPSTCLRGSWKILDMILCISVPRGEKRVDLVDETDIGGHGIDRRQWKLRREGVNKNKMSAATLHSTMIWLALTRS